MNSCARFQVMESVTLNARREVIDKTYNAELFETEYGGPVHRLLEKKGVDSFFWLSNSVASFARAAVQPPWAIALFEEDYDIADHIDRVRGQSKDILYSSFSARLDHWEKEGFKGKPVSVILIKSKSVLIKAAESSSLFKMLLRNLDDSDELGNWVCLAAPPPDETIS